MQSTSTQASSGTSVSSLASLTAHLVTVGISEFFGLTTKGKLLLMMKPKLMTTTSSFLFGLHFASVQGSVVYATDIQTDWKLDLNIVDIELGRNFWTSKYLAIRPHVGVRVAYINQSYDIEHRGGSWANLQPNISTLVVAGPFNNEVHLDNDFKSVGLRAGLDSTWNFGCGWALYGNFAASLLYGRFNIDHDEWNRLATGDHAKTKVLETDDNFRATRAAMDLALGLQWSTLFCDCKYGFTVALGWEHHLFFNMNQLWRVNRIGDTLQGTNGTGSKPYRRKCLPSASWRSRHSRMDTYI